MLPGKLQHKWPDQEASNSSTPTKKPSSRATKSWKTTSPTSTTKTATTTNSTSSSPAKSWKTTSPASTTKTASTTSSTSSSPAKSPASATKTATTNSTSSSPAKSWKMTSPMSTTKTAPNTSSTSSSAAKSWKTNSPASTTKTATPSSSTSSTPSWKKSNSPGTSTSPSTRSNTAVRSKSPIRVKVKTNEGSFKPSSQQDKHNIHELFDSGALIMDGVEDLNLTEVAKHLKREPNMLEKLVLKNCGVGDGFIKTLSQNLRGITHLDLSNNNAITDAAQIELVKAALTRSKVSTLKLQSNAQISSSHCSEISKLIQNNHIITEFQAEFATKPSGMDTVLSRNRDVGKYLARIEKANATLTAEQQRRLSVRDNELITTMVKAELNDPSVTEFVVLNDPRFTHIKPTIVADFGEGLRTNTSLKILKLNNLELGNIFLSALAASVETNFTLVTIDLANNGFTSDGMSEFCQAMEYNQALQYVDLRHQHSPLFSHAEDIVLDALTKNHYVKELYVEFKTLECSGKLKAILERNKKESKTIDYNEKLITFLKREAEAVEELAEQKRDEAKPQDIPDTDWEFYYELHVLAKKHQIRLIKEGGGYDTDDDDGVINKDAMKKDLKSTRRTNRSVSDTSGLDKKVNLAAVQFTEDGEFLTEEFISQYIVENAEEQTVAFDFSGQIKLFKRFPVDCSARRFIVQKFVDVILAHPKAKDFTELRLSNCLLGNDLLICFSEKCLKTPKMLPRLHVINLETNFISGPGVQALSKCLEKPDIWKYLQVIQLENQKFLLSSLAEKALAKALFVRRSVIKFSLRVRNIHERTRINSYISRNIDLLRQARYRHQKKTGTLKAKKRNQIEKFFDSIEANDHSITEVELVGDQLFLALNQKERIHAAKSFASNTQVVKVKMSLLGLDDEFAVEMGKSMAKNSSVESLLMENNAFTGEGIKAIVGSLATNKTITELQLRHQTKNMASSDESQLASLMGDNDTLVKFGVDIRHMQAKNDVERKILQNQEKARRNRKKTPGHTKSSEDKIKSVSTQRILQRVIQNDKEITSLIINKDEEFIKMEGFRKTEFFEGLQKNTHVKSLTLNEVKLDNSFADALIAILKKNNTLESISINKNAFTSLGVYTIVDAVTKKKQIRKLSILEPLAKISTDEADRLLTTMEKRCSLKELEIDFREKSQTERLKKILQK